MMTGDTGQIIRQLAESVRPVRPLARPSARAAGWLALSVSYIGVVFLVMSSRHDLSSKLDEPLFIIEQLAALATGISAAVAAFATVIPGYRRRWIILPLLSLLVWLGSLGPGCVEELNRFGILGLPLHHNLWCFPFIALLGAVPAIAIAVMLRRGAPLTPPITAALGGLAAAGLGNVGVRLIDPEDVTLMLLAWHVGGVVVISTLAAGAGHYLFNWRSMT
jgi:hypothetical protein